MNGRLDEPGAVVARMNLNAWRERARNRGEFFLHAADHLERVHPVAHDDDAADGFALPVPLGYPLPDIRAKGDGPEIAHEHWRPALGRHGYIGEVIERAKVAQAPDHVLRATHLEQAAADLVGARLNPVDDGRERDVVGPELHWIQRDLI